MGATAESAVLNLDNVGGGAEQVVSAPLAMPPGMMKIAPLNKTAVARVRRNVAGARALRVVWMWVRVIMRVHCPFTLIVYTIALDLRR